MTGLIFVADASKKNKKDNKNQDNSSLITTMKSSMRKKGNAPFIGLDPMGRGVRLPPHLQLSRELPSIADFPDTLPALEAATADWRPFEDWQIVMVSLDFFKNVLYHVLNCGSFLLDYVSVARTSTRFQWSTLISCN